MFFWLALPPWRRRPTGARARFLVILAVLVPVAALAISAMAPATAASAALQHAAVVHPDAGSGLAPYVDMSNSQESLLNTAITSDGLRSYTAAFAIGVGCNQEWGDTEPIGNDPFIDPEIAKAKSEGASLVVSSGGADGEPIAWTCTSQSTIDSAYRQVMSAYSPAGLDFDIEGAAEADTAAATRNFQAMRDDGISNYSITLPVLPSGLTNYGTGIVQAAQNLGMKIPVVNIMAMDYYQGNVEMGQAAEQAAQSTLTQLQAINPSYTMANIGITPMIGINDDGSDFTLSDASTLVNWANSNGVGRLAFWAVTRDQACAKTQVITPDASPTCSGVAQGQLQYTQTFTGFSGGGGGGGGNGFSIAVSPSSATVAQGSSTTATVSTRVTSGSSQNVTLSSAGKPSGVTTSFSPKSITAGGSSNVTVKVAKKVAAGTYSIAVKGNAASGTETAAFTLTVGSGGGGGGGGALTNGGFESGSLSPWTCQSGDAVVGSPVHSGSDAAQVAATGSQTGECDQTVTLSPNTSYTLTGWVEGSFAYIGVSGGANASTWTSSATWSQLTVPFTTGSSGTVTVFVHGWYSEGNVYADDFNLTSG